MGLVITNLNGEFAVQFVGDARSLQEAQQGIEDGGGDEVAIDFISLENEEEAVGVDAFVSVLCLAIEAGDNGIEPLLTKIFMAGRKSTES